MPTKRLTEYNLSCSFTSNAENAYGPHHVDVDRDGGTDLLHIFTKHKISPVLIRFREELQYRFLGPVLYVRHTNVVGAVC